VVAVLLSVCARAENGVAKLSTSRAGAVAHPPAVLVKFAESASTHDNMVKPVRLSDGRLLALSLTTHVRSQEMFGRYSSNDGVAWRQASGKAGPATSCRSFNCAMGGFCCQSHT